MSKVLSYRPDIDMLRAVAVLSVVVFHFDKQWLPGGFLGVDIFFVISGFLITMIIHREMSAGTFSFKAFYVRRIKRILPAFFVVVAASVLVGAYLFTQDDFSVLFKSALASMGFAANLYYARGQGYFDPVQEEKPLLHIWSLSVEEQYYFLFPLLLLLVVRRGWKTQFAFLLILILLSIAASFQPALLDKYYLPHLRAFEMLFGSLTAVWMQYQAQRGHFTGQRLAAAGSLISLLVLLVCLLTYTPAMPYFPGLAAAVPCLAAAAFLYFNHFNHALRSYYQWKPAVAVGLISYSLYLWHWPVLAFARYITGNDGLSPQWAVRLAVLMLFLSILSYFLVEKPFKKWKGSFTKSVICIYVLPMTAVSAGAFLLLRSPMLNQYNASGMARSYTSCHNNTDKKCVWGDETRQPEILVLGDSHADQYKTFFDYLGKKEHWSVNMISADSCAYVQGYDAVVYRRNSSCQAVYRYAQQHLPEYRTVIFIMRWGSQLIPSDRQPSVAYDPEFFGKFDTMLKHLQQENKTVYLFTDNPNIQYSGLRSFQLAQKLPDFHKTLHKVNTTTSQGNQKIKELAEKYPNVHLIDVAALIPDNVLINDLPVYSDLDHISPYGAKELAKKFAATQTLLQKP